MIKNFFKFLQLRAHNFLKAYSLLIIGTKIYKPSTIEFRGEIDVGKNVEIDNNVIFEGKVVLSDRVRIGSNCILKDCTIGSDTNIRSNSLVKGCRIGSNSFIGPYARIRSTTQIGENSQIGNFVEIKNSSIGMNSKINHLTFVGDALIGDDVIIGAGSVTCNFDGVSTQQTQIGDKAFIGSGVFLVAPVKVGNGATIGSGSVIAEDVPAKKLTLARSKQITIEDWEGPQKIDNDKK